MEEKKEMLDKAFETAKTVTELGASVGVSVITADIITAAWYALPVKHTKFGLVLRCMGSMGISLVVTPVVIDAVDKSFDDMKAAIEAKRKEK